VAVVNGQRPDLSLITGPNETLVNLIVDLIKRCWHQTPHQRPAFSGTPISFFRENISDSYTSSVIQPYFIYDEFY